MYGDLSLGTKPSNPQVLVNPTGRFILDTVTSLHDTTYCTNCNWIINFLCTLRQDTGELGKMVVKNSSLPQNQFIFHSLSEYMGKIKRGWISIVCVSNSNSVVGSSVRC